MGLHSSTFRLNVSAFCGIGVAFRDCCSGVFRRWYGVLGDIEGCSGCILCQKRLRWS